MANDSKDKKILITSCFAKGGVVSMRNMAARFLREGGMQVEFASYAPYQLFQNLSVPIWQFGRKSPSIVLQENHWWVGTWMPEWEFMRSRNSELWAELMSHYQNHLVVSGTALAAYPLLKQGLNPLSWLATPFWEERRVHAHQYPLTRKLMTLIDRPICENQERHVLEKCPIMSLGSYTEQRFKAIAPECQTSILPMPVDSREFYPGEQRTPGQHVRIGFCGRLDDPRKNINFLLKSFAMLKQVLPQAKLILAGGQLNADQQELLGELQIQSDVEVIPFLPREQLLKFYQSLDLFVIPSLQEGLGIVGLEAMSCGLPVVTTRCGGPQDFVYDGVNGHVVHFQTNEMSNAMVDILSDRKRWQSMSRASIEIARTDFNYQHICEMFWKRFNQVNQHKKVIDPKKGQAA